ncbi:MAG: formylglycine-generating enzyme family protein [Planctomycetales bacterium]
MSGIVLALTLLGAEPAEKQLPLLKTFHQEFVEITPGRNGFPQSFRMGDDAGPANQRPARRVVFKHSFSIARYEVPQNLWEAVMGNNPSRWKGPRNSVEMLSLGEARDFCRKATELMRAAKLIQPNQVVRLPSEAEWEFCARAGTKEKYSFGDDPEKLGDHGWFTGNATGNDPPVGAKLPNAWKLYDVHGYLWEWCSDSWHDDYQGAPETPAAWTKDGDAESGVLRGGSWKDPAEKLTSRYRLKTPRGFRDAAVGLRCVLAKEKP